MWNMRDRILIFAGFFLALFIAQSVHAQKKSYLPPVPPQDSSTFWIFKDMSLGPYFTVGITRQNEDLPYQWTSKPRFSNAFGITLDASVGPWFGFALTALYDSRYLYVQNRSDSDNIYISLAYLAVQPSIKIYWLLIGLAFDFPMSGSAQESIAAYQHYTNGVPDQTVKPYSENLNVATSDIATLTELRATISVPLFEEQSATLHIIVTGNYPLSKVLAGTSSFDTTTHFSGKFAPGQGPLPSIEAGLSYQFDLLH